MRVTRLDGCGRVALGPDSTLATEGFISVGLTANTEEGETISVTNAAGKICILDEPAPEFTGYTVEVAFCGVDPELFSMMTGQPVVLNAAGDEAVGFGVDSDVNVNDSGFALELWSTVPVAACDESGESSYGYFLIPFLKGGTLGDVTVENAAINFNLSGASTKDGNEWGVGPYDVVRGAAGDAGPLNEAISQKRHLHLEVTTVPPPTLDDYEEGAQALGTEADTAVAGSPGTLEPDNSYAPAEFADIGTLTAEPATAWTSGQFIRLRDGSAAHWDGTQWVAGVAD
jgi:hypothetical protein